MDYFQLDNVKVEKANAIRKYNRIRNLTKIFRLFEICLVLFVVSWCSSRLPMAFKISGDFLRHLSVVCVSPRFVFLLGNAIVVTLFAKSGQLKSTDHRKNVIYEEFLKCSEIRPMIFDPKAKSEELVFEDKAIYLESMRTEIHKNTNLAYPRKAAREYKRCRSEILPPAKKRDSRQLHRSETDVRTVVAEQEQQRQMTFTPTEMSNDELRRKVEAFIEREWKFRREEESMSIVLQNKNS